MYPFKAANLLCVVCLALCGCADQPVEHKASDQGVSSQSPVGSTETGLPSVRDLDQLIGLTESQVVEQLGPPTGAFELTIGQDGFGEEYVEVFNTYPPGDLRSQGVVIRIVDWRLPGKRKSVQMHRVEGEWRVLIAHEIDDGVKF